MITGASSGIGEATARLLATRGWRCVLVARRADRLRTLAEETGGEAEPCDIGDRAAVEELAARVLERHPAIGALVNNAGMPARRSFADVDLDLVEEVARVNYLGGVWLTRGLLPGLRPAQGAPRAHIVNVVSVAGAVASAPSGAYTAAKHAQLAYSRSLQASLRGSGIAVHSVLPGFVETEGFPQRALVEHRFMRRFVVQPERIAETIAKSLGRRSSEVVVPWFPYRPISAVFGIAPGLMGRLGNRTVASSPVFQSKMGDPPPEGE